MHSIDLEVEIPFHDLDPMNITWHGNYVRYIELARCKLLDSFDYGYQKMADSGYAWPIIDLKLRYIKPAIFEQKIIVSANLVEWENRLKIDYVIRDLASGQRLTKGYTTQVAVNMSTDTMCLQSPDILLEKLQQHVF